MSDLREKCEDWLGSRHPPSPERLVAFVRSTLAAAVAQEREACAKVADAEVARRCAYTGPNQTKPASFCDCKFIEVERRSERGNGCPEMRQIAAAIRSRGAATRQGEV